MAQASAENLEHTGPAEKDSGLIATKRVVGKYASAAFAKRKRNRAVCTKYQIVRWERVKVGESRTLAKKRGIRAGVWRGKDGLHSEERQVPRRRRRASNENLPRSRRKHERVSGCKSSPGRSGKSWFHSKSGQT